MLDTMTTDANNQLAHEQGLTPIIEALSAASVPFIVENTGGDVMQVVIPHPTERYHGAGIVADEENPGRFVWVEDSEVHGDYITVRGIVRAAREWLEENTPDTDD